MIPLAVPDLNGNERKYLNECIDSTFVSSVGQFVVRLEEMVSAVSGTAYAVATSAGTTALHTALLSAGVQRDDMVIIPSYTFIATANAVSHCGAIPWCIDIDEASWTMSADILEDELERKVVMIDGKPYHSALRRRIAAVVPVYTLGNPADIDRIKEIASRYGLPVVADAAAAVGAEYKHDKAGKYADITVYSFNGNKTVTCGGGGAIVSNDKELIDRAKHLSTTARVGADYDFDMVGYNYRMTNIQAAVGCAQMERLHELISHKRRIRQYYRNSLSDIKGICFFPEPEWGESTCWFSGIVFDRDCNIKIKEVCEKLKAEGIESRPFWKPVHLQLPYQNVEKSTLQVTESIWNRILTLPCSTGITTEELQQTVKSVRQVCTEMIQNNHKK